MNRKNHQHQSTSSEQAEMSLFWVTLKGSPAAINAIAQTAHALAKATVAGSNRVITPKPPVASLGSAPEDSEDEPETIVTDVEEAPASSSPPPVQSRPRKARQSKLVTYLDLDKDPESLATFVGARELKSWGERGVLAALWMRDHRQRAEFNLNELFTCFMHQWEAAPEDLNSFIRDMKDDKLVEPAGERRGFYTLSVLGQKKAKSIVEGN